MSNKAEDDEAIEGIRGGGSNNNNEDSANAHGSDEIRGGDSMSVEMEDQDMSIQRVGLMQDGPGSRAR